MSNEPESPADVSVDERSDEPEAGSNFDFFDPNSPLAPYYFRTSHVFAVLLVTLIFVFFNITQLGYSDVWGHLKFGEWIANNRQLPDHELFSPYSDPDIAAQNFQWLTQVISYGTYRFGAWLAGGSPLRQIEGGVDMLRALHALCEALKAIFLLLAIRRLTGSLPWAIAGVVLLFAFSLNASSVQRPQAFAEPLFAALLWILATREALTWKQIATVAVVMTLWTNLHGSFVIGLALIGLCFLGRTIEVFLARGFAATIRDDAVQNLLLAGLFSVSALSTLNPHGIYAISEVLDFAKSPNVLTMHEWKPLEFSAGAGGHWGYLILLGLVVLTQIVSPRVYSPTQLLLLAVFGVGPLVQERLMTWWVMIVPVIVLPEWAELLRLPPSLAERWTSVLSLRKTIIAAGIVLVGFIWSNFAQLVLGHPPTPIVASVNPATLWPITDDLLKGKPPASADDAKTYAANPLAVALEQHLKKYPGGQFRGGIFVPEAMGDYLVWSLPPKAPVMVYSHVHFFPANYWSDYVVVLMGQPGWKEALERSRVNLVVAPIDQRRTLYDSLKSDSSWTMILDQSDSTKSAVRLFAALRNTPLPLKEANP